MLPETEKKLFALAYTQSEENSDSYLYYLGCLIMNGQGYTITDLIMESLEDIRSTSLKESAFVLLTQVSESDKIEPRGYDVTSFNNMINVFDEEESERILSISVGSHIFNIGDNNNLSANISKFKNLERLHITLTRPDLFLPESIGTLKNLKELTLACNNLKELPESLGNLENLERLDLMHNNLTKLPDSLGNLTKLKSLHLSGNNELSELPETFGNLKNLKELVCYCRKLYKIPLSILDLDLELKLF